MPDYRLYVIGGSGHVVRVEEMIAVDDVAAIKAASLGRGAQRRELWCGARMVEDWALVERHVSTDNQVTDRDISNISVDFGALALSTSDDPKQEALFQSWPLPTPFAVRNHRPGWCSRSRARPNVSPLRGREPFSA